MVLERRRLMQVSPAAGAGGTGDSRSRSSRRSRLHAVQVEQRLGQLLLDGAREAATAGLRGASSRRLRPPRKRGE